MIPQIKDSIGQRTLQIDNVPTRAQEYWDLLAFELQENCAMALGNDFRALVTLWPGEGWLSASLVCLDSNASHDTAKVRQFIRDKKLTINGILKAGRLASGKQFCQFLQRCDVIFSVNKGRMNLLPPLINAIRVLLKRRY